MGFVAMPNPGSATDAEVFYPNKTLRVKQILKVSIPLIILLKGN